MRFHPRPTAITLAATQALLLSSGMALAQSAPADDKADTAASVVVTGRRAALQSAQKIKQNAEEVVDSIVAEEMGKLPDRSITEVLQRVVGITIDRTMAKNDPEHYSAEGSNVSIRGLSLVRSELNGRDTFSANGGRALSFGDIPPELMAAVDVYKNPSAAQIEGAIGGLVNLRTAMPFDYSGLKGSLSLGGTYEKLQGQWSPQVSGLISNRWSTPVGEIGALLSLAHAESTQRTDLWQVEPYYKIDPDGDGPLARNYWVPKGAQWRDSRFERNREGVYGALQWKRADMSSALTVFESRYKMHWDENALFAQSNPWNIRVNNGASYNGNNVLQTGTLTDSIDGGINFGADTRYMTRQSKTRDIGWNFKWKASDSWTFSTDVQLVKSTTDAFDSTVATGLQMPKETLDLTGSHPRVLFDASDLASLANPANYYWAFTMEHLDKSKAEAKSWRGDAKFKFEHPVLQDLSFGVRLSERDATTTNTVPGYNWQAITQPWQVGWDIKGLARLSDPRFSGNTTLHEFKNFFGGQSVPAIYVPDVSLAKNYPDSYVALHKYHDTLCAEQHGGSLKDCGAWTPASFGTDPSGTNEQHERTQAAYAQLRFDFDDWKVPVDGNLGLRLVRTTMSAKGFTSLTVKSPELKPGESLTGAPIPTVQTFSSPIDVKQTYTDVLPSLNLKYKVSNDLQFRAALSKAMARPDFDKMQAYTTLSLDTVKHTEGNKVVVDSVSLTGTANGNPALKPVKANQLDLTAEWYFAKNGSLTVALFDKELKDVIINQTNTVPVGDANGTPVNFTVTSPVNGAKGYARGFEVAFQRYFDMLPGWASGLGLQANYTFVDSKTKLYNPVNSASCSGTVTGAANLNLNLNGCDTDGTTFGNMPLQNLSKHAYNIALLYDQGPVSAKLAYSWRSKYLQAINVNGTQGSDGKDSAGNSVAWGLPVWNDAYGQFDGSIAYTVNDALKLSLEGENLTGKTNRQLMQQQIGMMTRAVFYTGPRYTLRLNYQF